MAWDTVRCPRCKRELVINREYGAGRWQHCVRMCGWWRWRPRVDQEGTAPAEWQDPGKTLDEKDYASHREMNQ